MPNRPFSEFFFQKFWFLNGLLGGYLEKKNYKDEKQKKNTRTKNQKNITGGKPKVPYITGGKALLTL